MNLNKYLKPNFNMLYLILISIILYIIILSEKLGVLRKPNPVGEALMDFTSVILILIIPLIFNIHLLKKLGIFLILVIPFTLFGIQWTLYSEFGSFIFIYYDIIIFVLIIIWHFIIKKNLFSKKILIFLIFVLFLSSTYLTYEGVHRFNQHVTYSEIRCKSHYMNINEFEDGCNKLNGEFWEKYQRICIENLVMRKNNYPISKDFQCPSCCSYNDNFFPIDGTRPSSMRK